MLIKDAKKITDSFTKTSAKCRGYLTACQRGPARPGPSLQKFLARLALDAMQ